MRFIRALGNLFFMITSPLWVLPVFFTVAVWSAIEPKKYPEFWDVVSGKSWII